MIPEPYYDGDYVTLGYLNNKIGQLSTELKGTNQLLLSKSQNFGTQPNPPYRKYDTYMSNDGIYICVNERLIGTYNPADWTKASTFVNVEDAIHTGITTDGTLMASNGGTNVAGLTGVSPGDSATRIWAGSTFANRGSAPFRVTQGGFLYANNAQISGKITASSGTIGGWNISNTFIDSVSGNSRFYLASFADGSNNLLFARDSNNITRFYLTKAGKLFANNAEITGTITANSGTIGGWNISNVQLQKSIGQYSFEIRTDRASNQPALLVYDSANARYNFYVRPDGFLYARNAEINGTINATSGTIGGFTLSSAGFSGGTSTGTMRINRGSSASVDFPANGGRLMLASSARGGVALTSAGESGSGGLCISDAYSHTGTGHASATIGIRTIYGWLRLASDVLVRLEHGDGSVINVGGSGIGTYTGIELKAAGEAYVRIQSAIQLQPKKGSYAYVGSVSTENRILTTGGSPSSKNVKTNIKAIDNYLDIYKDIQNMNLYQYKYKYKGLDENDNYGFIIEELEKLPNVSKFIKNYEVIGKLKDDELLQNYAQGDYPEIKYKKWDIDSYVKSLFILIKSLQIKIDELEKEIEKIKGGK